jgi:restriction endonuclease S subunit
VTAYHRLSALGELRSGYSSRTSLDVPPDQATHKALPTRALTGTSSQPIDWSQLDPIRFEGNAERYRVRDGDVLIPSRGLQLKAVFVEKPPEQVLVLNNWALLSPSSLVQGRYLVWWFNHSQTQQEINQLARGSRQIFLPMSALRQLEVPVPSPEVQGQIIRLDHLRQQERELVEQREHRRDELIEALTLKLLETELDNLEEQY